MEPNKKITTKEKMNQQTMLESVDDRTRRRKSGERRGRVVCGREGNGEGRMSEDDEEDKGKRKGRKGRKERDSSTPKN